MRTVHCAPGVTLDLRDVSWHFLRAPGPGGQHVNKVSTAVQVRYNPCGITPLPPSVRDRLPKVAGCRMTADGYVIVTARRFRSQAQNRRDALQRLVQLLRTAAYEPSPRRATRATRSSHERRLRSKRHRSQLKALRHRVFGDD